MGRISKLTDKQWEVITQRLLDGDTARSLAREFGITESAIRKRLGAQTNSIKTVANQIVETDRALKALPIGAQIRARTLAERLAAISDHLAGAAEYNAATAHRLSGIAHAKVAEIDDAAPLDSQSMEALKGIAVLTRMANEASEIPLNLLNANKDAAKAADVFKDGIAFKVTRASRNA
jgi:hypothetical protein